MEYIDGSGDVVRVGPGEVAEAYVEAELGLRGGGGGRGTEVSGVAVCDTVLERPREKISPGRDGREEDAAGEVVDTVDCDVALSTQLRNSARQVGEMYTHCKLIDDT